MDQVERFIRKKEYVEEVRLEAINKQIEDFLSFNNSNYIDFLRSNVKNNDKTIFDTNIYSPIHYEWVIEQRGNNLEERIKIFSKASDFQKKLIELLVNDKRIITTEDIIKELIKTPRYWKVRLGYDIEKLDRATLMFLKENIREYIAGFNSFYDILSSDNRIFSVNNYCMNSHYDFKILLLRLLDQSKIQTKGSVSDRNIVYIMINQSLKEPTSTITKDRDLFILINNIIGNIVGLNKKLKRYDLKVSKKKNKNINTYVFRSMTTQFI